MAAKRSRRDAPDARPSADVAAPVVGMVSLGCAKNTADTERVLGMLASAGFIVSTDTEIADVVVVNTCAFIAPAREETEAALRELAASKPVVAIGCYAERFRRGGRTKPARAYQVRKIRGVAAFVPFDLYDDLPRICLDVCRDTCDQTKRPGMEAAGRPEPERTPRERFADSPRMRVGAPATAYLKIAEGCGNRCSYCALPDIRGPLRSEPFDKLLDEAESLVGLGAREICVIAQDTASYGADLGTGAPRLPGALSGGGGAGRKLPDLLRRLCAIRALRWVRLLYVHPAHLTDGIIDVLAGEEEMCCYLDLPIQHVSTRVLSAMGRRYDGEKLRATVERLRARVGGVTLRTTVMTGFPGETEEEFAELLAFVREIEFDHLGVFCYSPERNTPAAKLKGHVPSRVARARAERIMAAQKRIAFAKLDARLGGTETAMIELPIESGRWSARTEREAPEVDGEVFVEGVSEAAAPGSLRPASPAPGLNVPGELLRGRIAGRLEYDLAGTAQAAGNTQSRGRRG